MPDTDSIVIAKSFNYRGVAETWTNKYHLEGTTPTTIGAARDLLRAIWDLERTIVAQDVTLVGGAFYNAGEKAAAFMFDPTNIGGTATTNKGAQGGSSAATPGDCAFWVRWATDERNSMNKPIYLRKYFHGFQTETDGDLPAALVRTAAIAMAAKMYDGTLPGGMKICGPQGANAVSHAAAQFTTTRTLKRNARTPT